MELARLFSKPDGPPRRPGRALERAINRQSMLLIGGGKP